MLKISADYPGTSGKCQLPDFLLRDASEMLLPALDKENLKRAENFYELFNHPAGHLSPLVFHWVNTKSTVLAVINQVRLNSL